MTDTPVWINADGSTSPIVNATASAPIKRECTHPATFDAILACRWCHMAMDEQVRGERDAALAEVERLTAMNVQLAETVQQHYRRAEQAEADRDRAVRDARRDALDQAEKAIVRAYPVWGPEIARIVAGLRDSEATS